jgi:glycosyltransferase involved in cell wall biosynthesis
MDIYTHARADGETFGVNIAEAMIHGKPVVTHIAEPSVPGMGVFQSQTDLIDNAMNGFVCENNVDDYAQALRILIDSDFLRQEFGVHAREKALEEYEAAVCTAKLEDIYMSLTNG